jgi:uncharacterized membrane protein
MTGDSTTVLGIEIPSTDPVFLAVVIAIHIPLGIACVIFGAVAMLSEKRRGRHSTFGTVYYWSLCALFASATFLSIMRWAENYHLFILGAFSLVSAWCGRAASYRFGRTCLMSRTGCCLLPLESHSSFAPSCGIPSRGQQPR